MYCKHCGSQIANDCAVCPNCGKQIQEASQNVAPQIVINNTNTAMATATATSVARGGRAINKWVALALCLFLGVFGAHKFYEGRIGTGILYLLTGGVFFIGWFIDCIAILFKSNPYYV